jgi:putative transposase
MGWHDQARQRQTPSPPTSITAHAIWLYFRFPLSLRFVEEMLLERGIAGSCETIHETTRVWDWQVQTNSARQLRRKQPNPRQVGTRVRLSFRR